MIGYTCMIARRKVSVVRKENTRNTKGIIISAAWKLFYEQGYDDTAVEEILSESGTSRGFFYYYFYGDVFGVKLSKKRNYAGGSS